MKPFVFRAAAALELRKTQEHEAQLAHAAAESAANAAEQRLKDTRAAVIRAGEASVASERAGADSALMTWHRSWIVRLRIEVGAREAEAAVSAVALARAAASMQKAHQRRRTLERLRDRNAKRYDAEVQRIELTEMNLLAGLRFVARKAEKEGME